MTGKWLLCYSEIFLKSDPVRRRWEEVLIANIRKVMPGVHVRSERGRIWLDGDVDPELLKNIFGIVSFSPVEQVRLQNLEPAFLHYCHTVGIGMARTFAVRIKRVGNHPFSSREKAIELGNLIRNEFPSLKVNLALPDKEIFIEIRDDDCYLYEEVYKGVGGLPLGVEGILVALISGGIDSPVAAWMMMKRGCRIIPLFISLDGVLDESNLKRSEMVVEVLRKYQPDIRLVVINDSYLEAARSELVSSGQEKYTCILCKRRMYRIAEEHARSVGAKGIVTGESIGQVASQTLDNILVLNDAVEIPVLRPLIGFDTEETIRIARDIGTFIPSTVQASSCRAVPQKPSTKADLDKILEIEKQMVGWEDEVDRYTRFL